MKKYSVWRSRLFWRLIAMNAAAVIAFLLITSAYLEFELKDLLLAESTRDLETRARMARELLGGSDGDMQANVLRAAEVSGTRVTVITRDGAVRADSEAMAADMDDHGSRPEVSQALKTGYGSAIRFSGTRGAEFLYVAIADTDKPETDVIRVAMPMRQLSRRLEVVQDSIYITVGVLLIVGLALSFVLSRYVVRPIEVMRAAAGEFARGNLDVKVEMARRDELGELVGAFNSMGRELQNRVGQLEANRREISTIMDNMSEGLLLVDATGNVVLANKAAAQLLNAGDDSMEGHALWESVRLPEVDELLGSLPKLTEPRRIWVEDRTHGAQRRVLAFVATPLFDTAGGEQHAVILISDATEDQKLLEMRQDFVANVSHELKTPLTSISAYVETLLDGAADDESVREPFLRKIQANTSRLSKLVSDILNLSRLESDVGEESRQHLDLNELARDCVSKHREGADEKGVTVTLHPTDKPAVALVNEEDMLEALDNLVVNAISYTQAGGSVEVRVKRSETGLVLEVADTGSGIPQDALTRVFERFYRVDKARSRALGGTGLGLAIVKHVAIKHGGSVKAESEVGKGSTFRITLPASKG
ncbi:MAG: cell wall metabolism sensor histidine kinase WalK [Planctomycetes bacterium]|nr:cell wall metabolism sensor histidine kinase WalK [Planctomycetota bacterium]